MEILEPTQDLPTDLKLSREAGPDTFQETASSVGRVNAVYDSVWTAVRKAPDTYWVPVICNETRRAILLACTALQHRKLDLQVWRRGRVVCVRRRLTPVHDVQEPTCETVSTP